jgi:hypothetical protein
LRDQYTKEDLWWKFVDQETTSVYLEGRRYLESIGYIILSVTGDGFSGIKQAFLGIPYQMCLVHMERIVIRGTTNNPKLLQGKVLLALTKTLFTTNSKVFNERIHKYIEMNRDFLNEKTVNPLTGETWYTHDDLRKASFSLVSFLPYLFTYEKDTKIPRTTNSLEGHFSHTKDILDVHRGTSKVFKQKIINSILLAGTISPSDEILQEVI